MIRKMKSIGILLLALLVFLPLNANKAFAYTFNDLEAYIENPDWFDNQEGRASDNTDSNRIDFSYPRMNSDVIYFDKTHKSYQLLIRQYDKEKGIDLDNDDFTWSVMDERICTVDKKGLVKAGKMTGATVVIAESMDYIMTIVVVNLTGNYYEWYEKMFMNNRFRFYGGRYDKDEEERSKALGYALKVIVNAFDDYEIELYTNPRYRLEVIRNALSHIHNNEYEPEIIFTLFLDDDREQKCAYAIEATEDGRLFAYTPHVLLLDGIVYECNVIGGFYEIAREKDGYWKDGYFYCDHIYFDLFDIYELVEKLTTNKDYNYNDDRDYMINKLRGIKKN